MKNKTKKILATTCLGLVWMGCLTACSAEDLKIPTEYKVETTITQEKQYRLTVINDSEHGTIYPDISNETSSVMVEEGDDYTFSIRAKEGYKLDNLFIDGELVAPQEIYTFEDVNTDHSIGAIYSKLEEAKEIKSLILAGIRFYADESVDIKNSEIDLAFHQIKNPTGYEIMCPDNKVELAKLENVTASILGSGSSRQYDISVESSQPIYLDGDNFKLAIGARFLPIYELNISDLEFVGNTFYNLYKINVGDKNLYIDNDSQDNVQVKNVELYFLVNY